MNKSKKKNLARRLPNSNPTNDENSPSYQSLLIQFSNKNTKRKQLLAAHIIVLIRVVEEVVGRKLLVSVARNECLDNEVAVETHLAQLDKN